MSFFGLPRGRNKALSTVRILINNVNPTNNASLFLDSGSPTTVTFYPGTWLPLFTSSAVAVNNLEVFDSNGTTNRVGTGAAASEVDLFLDLPGGNGFIPVFIVAGTRISIQPISNPAVGAEVDINWYD